jgi:hypothetical protein
MVVGVAQGFGVAASEIGNVLTHGVKYFKGEEPVPSGYSFNN